MTAKKLLAALLTVSAVAAVSTTSSPSKACGGEWYPEVERINYEAYRLDGLARAEKALDRGQVALAAGSVIRMWPHIRSLKPYASNSVGRGQRLLAVAMARSHGGQGLAEQLPDYIRGEWMSKTDQQQRANLEWSISTLRGLASVKKGNVALESDLGEALAQVPEYENEARTLLERLAQKDVLATPQAYAALARLREKAGDTAGRTLALQRCETMTKDKQVCTMTSAHT